MKNITLKQYASLPDTSQYDAILPYLNPQNTFIAKSMNLHAMPYSNVKYCIRLLPKINSWEGVAELFSICFEVDETTFWNAGVTEYFAARNYIVSAFEKLIVSENKLLSGINTNAHIWEMAGGGKLKPYSDTLPLLQLGKLLGQYPYDLGRKPYGEIFSLLTQTKAQNEVEQEYRKLQKG
jgi:hypothetical protein